MARFFNTKLWTRDLRTWYLYDMANSFVTIMMSLYFAQWVIVDNKVSDFWFAFPAVVATLILVFISTHVGAVGDRYGNHNRIFVWTTILAMLSVVVLIVVGRFVPTPWNVFLALVFYGVYQFFVQLAMVPYYAFIKHITPPEQYGKVSGIGFSASQIGNVGGLLLSLLVIGGTLTFFGTDRLAPVGLGLFLFVLFFIPIARAYANKRVQPTNSAEQPFWRAFVANIKDTRKYPGVLPLLLAFYFFSDAIATLSLFSAVYLERVFGIPDAEKANILILILIGFGIGSYIAGILSDKNSHRRVLIWSLLIEGISIIAVAVSTSVAVLTVAFFIFGLMMGAVYASARAYLSSLIPVAESGTFFGLYTFAERFASVIGPLIWGIIIWLLAGYTPLNYRVAAFVMGLITLLGIFPLLAWTKKVFPRLD